MLLSVEEAIATCSLLRCVSSSTRDALSKRLHSERLSRGTRSLDKSGAELQEEALHIALLMRGAPPSDAGRRELLQVCSFSM